MKRVTLLSNKKRKEILIELEKEPKKFVQLKKILKIESNLLSYNLHMLSNEGLLEKKGLYFGLSNKGKHAVVYVPEYSDVSKIPLPCVVVIIKKGNEVLVKKKVTEPDKGKLSFIGHKLKQGEDIYEYSRKIVKKDADIEIKNLKLICTNNYIIKNKDEIKSHYLVFFVRATSIGEPKKGLFWKNYKRIGKKMVPDNDFILKNMLSNRYSKVIHSIFDESSKKFKVVSIY